MTNSDTKTNPLPKLPPMNFGRQPTSMFSGNKGYMPKGNPKAKFNKAVFTTQHKGGPSGGK